MASQKTFLEMFHKYTLDKDDKELLENSFLESVKAKKEAREVEIILLLSSIVNAEILEKISEKLKKIYSLNKVYITPKYSEKAFVIPDCYNYLLHTAKKQIPMVNGFLNGSTPTLEDNYLTIQLKNNSSPMLKEGRLDVHLQELIYNQFGMSVKVFFIDAQNVDQFQVLKEMQDKELKKISESRPVIVKEEKPAAKVSVANSENPEIIMGKPIKDNTINISEINEHTGRVCCWGDVFSLESKTTKAGDKLIVSFNIGDGSGSISAKLFGNKDKIEPFLQRLKNGIRVIIKGEVEYDKFLRDILIKPLDITQIEKSEKKDKADQKRVELHCHTNMSALDAVVPTSELIKRAAKWGHKAIAITDHGVAQAYPDAMNASKGLDVKVIYGLEAYFVNDSEAAVHKEKSYSFEDEFIVFDIETTGLSAANEAITEIGAVLFKNGEIIDTFCTFVDPERPIPSKVTEITGITDAMVKGAPKIEEALGAFYDFAKGRPLVAHNAPFDASFIKAAAIKTGREFPFTYIDTVPICRFLFPSMQSVKLNLVAKHLELPDFNHHRASDDATILAKIWGELLKRLKAEQGIENIDQINSLLSGDAFKSVKSTHLIILVKNYVGLKNLYKLISHSHLKTFYRKKPRILKSQLMQYREGLIIGSACEAGELYTAVLEGAGSKELEKIASFYDYLEIQPLGNNGYLINNNKVDSAQKLKEFNQTIVRLGEKLKKLVVATGDVHFLDEKDEIFRRILMAGQGFEDADNQAPLYFKTTDEMLEEFSYLGREKAFEVVVTNTNLIAELCENIRPVPKEAFPPEMEGAEEELKRLTVNKATEIYGEPLPTIVEERMNRELGSIIKHGFSVMYMIAQKLVAKSLSDGYLVGSRGSVGSSFVAFLSGITEVNSLCPHYICPSCKQSEFTQDGSFECGADMPNKNCPSCGGVYKKDGFDIPFETFLGFDGDKAPDIDLNFSGEYQPVAHKYTEELFGEGYVFRAGTIGTIADKTAFGFVSKYYEGKGVVLHRAETQRLINGCVNVKRTTGQHPGGVMIVPKSKEIFDFCPIQHPADDVNSSIITTHFDYHSIHDNLLKLDILGHDDPTAIRMLEGLTGIDAKKIPLDDKPTMSLFTSLEHLGFAEDDVIKNVSSYAIPEFGTRFVRQMLTDTKPTTFAELVRISGLSHGTDVWINNAQTLVNEKTATLKEAICTRDDIMLFLIHKGLPKKSAFNIMEKVRKGKGLSPEDEELMRQNNVPEWYINSCNKIKYMFPKAHAVAYVTMAFRIAYFKVHFPLAFYATYFTVRADAFDAASMTKGMDRAKMKMKEIELKEEKKEATQKDKDMLTVLEVCYEMYKRGFKFLPIDLYRSDVKDFIITEEGLLPPLNALQGLGVNAAASIAESRQKGEFMSIDDLRVRAGITKAVIEKLSAEGVLNGMDESSQMAMF